MNFDLFSLQNKLAIVTGGGSGIGFSMAQYLAKAGARVVIIGRDESKLQKSQKELTNNGVDIGIYRADVSREEEIKKCAKDISSQFGDVDIIVNAAGVNLRQNPEDITFESWDQTLDINLKTPFFLTREFLPNMIKKKRGKVINIASLQSVRAFEKGMAYGASKGGVMQLTRAMAQAYSKDGICVNAIAPGFFETPLTKDVFKDETRAKALASQTAIGRNGNMQDFEGITIFLASQASDYITGHTIFLDGGFTAK